MISREEAEVGVNPKPQATIHSRVARSGACWVTSGCTPARSQQVKNASK